MNRCKSCDQKLTDDDFGWLCDSCFTVEAKYHDPQHHQIARRLVFLGVTKTDYSYEEIAAIIAQEADIPSPTAPASARAIPAPAMGTPESELEQAFRAGYAQGYDNGASDDAAFQFGSGSKKPHVLKKEEDEAWASFSLEKAQSADVALRAAQTEKL